MKDKKLLSLSTGLAISLSAMLATQAQASPFKAELLKTGYDNNANNQAEKMTDGQCGAGRDQNMDTAVDTMNADGEDMQMMDSNEGAADSDTGIGTDASDTAEDTMDNNANDAVEKKPDGKCSAGQCGDDVMKKATGGECADKAKDGRCGVSGNGQ